MGKGSAPKAPDPAKTAAAQTTQNVDTAIANSAMGMVDQFTPYGSLTYSQQDSGVDAGGRDIPRYTATTTLSPEQQAILAETQASQQSLAETANERAAFLRDYLPGSEALTDQIDGKLYDLGAERLDPRFARQEDQLRTRLANQGVTAGSEAWKREMDQFGQGQNDAYTQLMLQGRGQALSEVNNPINQITALLSGSQVSNPNVSLSQPAQMPTTDVAGIQNAAYGQQMQGWQQGQQNKQAIMGGLFDLGAAGIMASDIRVKRNISEVDRRVDGLGVYRFQYIGNDDWHTGFMAQEVEKIYPYAVSEIDGIKHVNYGVL